MTEKKPGEPDGEVNRFADACWRAGGDEKEGIVRLRGILDRFRIQIESRAKREFECKDKIADSVVREWLAEREAEARAEGAREALERAAATQCGGCKRGDSPYRPPHRAHIESDDDWWHENHIRCHAGPIISLIRALADQPEAEGKNTVACPNCGRAASITGCEFCELDEGPAPAKADALPLGHEFEGKGPAVPGCKRYMGGDPNKQESYCCEEQAAHKPEAAHGRKK